jgi:hypothetical protein
MTRRLSIDRLDLDLRGIDPAVAEAAVRLLGPALQEQLAQRQGPFNAAARIDAGSIAVPATAGSEPRALANGLAQRIAQRTRES